MWRKLSRKLVFPLFSLLLLSGYLLFEFRTGQHISSELAFLETELVQFHAAVDGQLKQRMVSEWQPIGANSLLFSLDDSASQAQLQQLQLEIAAQQARLDERQAALKRLLLQISAQQADIQLAGAALTLSERELARAQRLQSAALLDTQQQQRLAFRRDEQRHQLQQQRNRLAQLQAEQQQLEAELAAKQLQAQQLLSQRQELQRQLGLLQQYAPTDGQISRWLVQSGSFVQAGDLLAEFVPAQPRWVVVYLRETDLAKIRAGQLADVRFDVLPDQVLQARLYAVSPLSGRQLARLPPDYTSSYVIRLTQRIPVRLELLDSLPFPASPGLAATVVFRTPSS